MEYLFTLKYRLRAQDTDGEALIDRLFEAGCDDAHAGALARARQQLVDGVEAGRLFAVGASLCLW